MTLNFVIPEFNIGGAGTPPLQFFKRGFNLQGSSGGGSWTDIILKGNTALTLTNAKANGLNYLKLFGGTSQRNLPSGYTQLEFLQSDGACYIDLLRVPNNNDIIEQKFQRMGTSTTTCSWYGSMPSSQQITPRIGIGTFSSQGVKLFAGTNYTGDITDADTNIHTLRFQATGRQELTYTLDGVTAIIDASTAVTPPDMYEPAIELTSYLFARHGTNGVQVYDNEGTKIYYHREYLANGTLALDVVPVKRNSDNVLGMYDTVTGTFLTNQGAGTFTAGPTAVPSPDEPMDIVSNNGVIKYSPNLVNIVADNVDLGHYISTTGVYSESVSNFLYVPYIKVQPNTTYTLSFSEELYYITISEYSANDGTGFIQRNTGTTGGNTSLTVTTQATTQYIRFGSNPYGNNNTVTMEQVLAINWMLAKADTPQTYIPYGQIYVDGTVETIGMIAGNIISGDIAGANINSTGKVVSSAKVIHIAPVVPGETYTCDSVGIIAYFTDIPVMGSVSYDNSRVTTTNPTFTVPNDPIIKYVAFSNDTATSYCVQGSVLYNGGTATAEMLLAISSYQDIQSVLDGEVTRNVGILVLDGVTSGKKIGTAWNSTYKRGSFAVSDMASTTSGVSDALCNYFKYSQEVFNNPTTAGFCTNNGTIFISFLGLDNVTSAETANDWLANQYNSGNPVVVVYPLATPTTESVTSQPLTIQAGTNIVEITQASIDNLELEVSYKGTL